MGPRYLYSVVSSRVSATARSGAPRMPAQARSVVVHKFGGAALADAGAIASVVRLLALDRTGTRRVVAASALKGVTDALVGAAGGAAAGDLDGAVATARELRARHLDVATDLMLDAPAIA